MSHHYSGPDFGFPQGRRPVWTLLICMPFPQGRETLGKSILIIERASVCRRESSWTYDDRAVRTRSIVRTQD